MGCCSLALLRNLFFMFNLILWILGIVLLTFGIRVIVTDWEWENLIDVNPETVAAYILIVSGAVMVMLGFIGCYGSARQDKCFLMFYIGVMLVIILAELSAGIFIAVKKEEIIKSLQEGITEVVWHTYGRLGFVTRAVNYFQETVRCCGVMGPHDWENSNWYKSPSIFKVPKSCCQVTSAPECNIGAVERLMKTGSIYDKGCVPAAVEFVSKHLWVLGGTTLAVMLNEAFLIICAMLLCRAARDD